MTLDVQEWAVELSGAMLEPIEGSIKLDRGWSPFVQGSITVPIALDVDALSGHRVHVRMRQRFGVSVLASAVSAQHAGKKASQISTLYAGMTAAAVSALYFTPFNSSTTRNGGTRTLDLMVRSVRTNVRAAETVIGVSSDEGAAQDFRLVQTDSISYGTSSVRSIATQVLALVGARLIVGDADATLTGVATWEPGVTAWDFLAPLVQQAGLRLWCDGRRAWHLQADASPAVGGISLSSRATVTQAQIDSSLDDDTWADAVVLKYVWRDSNGVEQVRFDVAGPARHRKAFFAEIKQAYPGPGGAAQVLRRRQRLGRAVPVEAVSDYATEPGMAFTVSVEGIPQQSGRVEAVEWRMTDAEMTVESLGLEQVDPQSIRAIPASYRIRDLPSKIKTLRPGEL